MPYSPAARGIIASNSAYVSAPASESSPAKTQTASAFPGLPTLHVITRAFKNTPVPMMLATLTEMAAISPRPRMSCLCSVCIVLGHGFNPWLIPGVVGDQIFVSVAAADQMRLAVAADQDRSGQRPPVVVKHLGQRIRAAIQQRQNFAGSDT